VNSREREAPPWPVLDASARVPRGMGPYTGPGTSGQLVALRELEQLAAEQDSGAPTGRVHPPEPGSNGRHRGPESTSDRLLRRHGARFASFSVIGGGIFIAGLLIQAVLTSGLHVPSFISYIFQAVVSVEASYFLNRWFTWKGVRTSLWASFLRYNLQKVVTVTANLILYGILLKLGMEYLLANILLTVVFTFVNYVGADRLVFLQGSRQMVAAVTGPLPVVTGPMPVLRVDRQPVTRPRQSRRELPSISVVIPVRGNEATIRAAVDSILHQDYPLMRELILVGSPGDSTWSALHDVDDPRLFVMETPTPPGIRDANFKRDLGIRQTSGVLVSLIDSDMVIPSDWMSNAVRLLMENEVDCVAGVMRSIHDDFWGRFVDGNRLGAKTPRAKAAYLVTAEGFGAAGYKPPITADILFTKKMYQDCPIDGNWSHGSLEDYEWFWRVVERGHRVLVSNQLFGWHHHRSGFKKLIGEYRRSARGCAYFIRAHRESPFAQKRMTQAIVLPMALFGILLGLGALAYMGHGALGVAAVLAFVLGGMAFLSTREFARTRTVESLIYPIPALILGVNYTASLVTHLIRSAPMRTAAPTSYDLPVPKEDTLARNKAGKRLLHPLIFILGLQAGLSLSLVWSNTAFTDEADYLWVGTTLIGHLRHGTAWPTYWAHHSLSGLPYIYPLLGGLANLAGGLPGARLLSLFFMLCSTGFIYLTGKRLFGLLSAVCAAGLWGVFTPTIFLGAFATYDALSISLMACSAWLITRVLAGRYRGELVAASAIVLAISSAAAYSAVIMIPVVALYAFLVWLRCMTTKTAAFCAAWFVGTSVLAFAAIMTLSKCWPGIIATVFARNGTALHVTDSYSSVSHVFNESWGYLALLTVLAVIGAICAIGNRIDRSAVLLLSYLAVTSLVFPAAQAYGHTGTSIKKHIAYGAIFAVVAAGYGVSEVVRALPVRRFLSVACCAIAALFPAVSAYESAASWFQSWASQSSILEKLSPLLASHPPMTISMYGGTYFCQYEYARYGNAWEGCSNSLNLGNVEDGKSDIIVLGYPATLAPPSALPAELLLSPNATNIQFINALDQSGSGGEINLQNETSLSRVTTLLDAGSDRYRLMGTGSYGSNQSVDVYAVWQRIATPVVKADGSSKTAQKPLRKTAKLCHRTHFQMRASRREASRSVKAA
jgi:putative flippase GtrA/glycosyltransferase involved in cell wall biosynthesis